MNIIPKLNITKDAKSQYYISNNYYAHDFCPDSLTIQLPNNLRLVYHLKSNTHIYITSLVLVSEESEMSRVIAERHYNGSCHIIYSPETMKHSGIDLIADVTTASFRKVGIPICKEEIRPVAEFIFEHSEHPYTFFV